MTSSYTASNRLLKQGAGDNTNTWGDLQSSGDFDRIDEALDGWATIALSGPITLASANALADQARMRMLKFTGGGAFTVTIPPVSKFYLVWNAATGALTVSNGSASVALQPGEIVGVINDGAMNMARVQPTDLGGARLTSVGSPSAAADAATKGYVDAQAFAPLNGNLPGQGPGTVGQVLGSNGSVAGWVALTTAMLTDYAADQAARAAATQAAAVAQANAFAACWALLF